MLFASWVCHQLLGILRGGRRGASCSRKQHFIGCVETRQNLSSGETWAIRRHRIGTEDVEDDAELRAALALYKNTKKTKRQPDPDAMSVAETEVTEADDGTGINMNELLDDFDELDIQDEMVEE